MYKWINKCNEKNVENGLKEFKSYYTRIWKEKGKVWFDVGSYSEFFIWEADNDEFIH